MTEIHLTGTVGGPTFNPDIIRRAPAGPLRVVINSDGGDGVAGMRCYAELRKRQAEVEIISSGSSASLVAMAGDRRSIHADGWLGLHASWSLLCGHAEEIRAQLAEVESLDNAYLLTFTERTGVAEAQLRQLMREQAVLEPERALQLGFVTEIAPASGQAPAPPRGATLAEQTLARARAVVEAMPTGFMRSLLLLALPRLERAVRHDPGTAAVLVGAFEWECPRCSRLNFGNPNRGCGRC